MTAVRMSASLRYFAGGRPENITLVHIISHSEVFNSIWKVIDGVLQCPQLQFEYLSSHHEL